MSDSEESDTFCDQRDLYEIHEEIEQRKMNPDTSGMFVSGWDDEDQDIEVVEDPKANPIDHILWAAENGVIEDVQQLINKQPELVDARDADGYTPLHRAAYSNHLSIISYLLSVGAKVSARTELGWTPLHSACKWNNYRAVARLLAAGADPAQRSDGEQTPLHLASAIAHCKSTLLILLLREDSVELANRPNNSGESPHQLAIGHGIYAPLYEMVFPAASFIHSLAFTCNPFVRSNTKR